MNNHKVIQKSQKRQDRKIIFQLILIIKYGEKFFWNISVLCLANMIKQKRFFYFEKDFFHIKQSDKNIEEDNRNLNALFSTSKRAASFMEL